MIEKFFVFFRKMLLYSVAITLVVTMFNACLPSDLDDIDLEFKPEIFIPLAYGTFELEDVINVAYDDTTTLTQDEDGLFKVSFREDSIYSESLDGLLQIPKDFTVDDVYLAVGEVPYGDLSYTESLSFGEMMIQTGILDSVLTSMGYGGMPLDQVLLDLNGQAIGIPDYDVNIDNEFTLNSTFALNSVIVNEGELQVKITNEYPVAIGFSGVILDTLSNDTLANIVFEKINPGESDSISKDISGYTISENLTAKATSLRSYDSNGPVIINSDADLILDLAFSNLEFEMDGEETIMVDLEDGYNLSAIATKNAKIGLDVEAGFPVDAQVIVELPDVTQNGEIKTVTIDIPAKSELVSRTIDISNSIIDFTGGMADSYNQMRIDYKVIVKTESSYDASYPPSDSIKVSVVMKNVEFDYLEGDIAEQVIALGDGNADFPLDFWDSFDGDDLSFNDPKIRIKAENSIGMRNKIDIDFSGVSNTGTTVPLAIEGLSLNAPGYPSDSIAYTDTVIDKTNSDLLTFMNTKFSTVQYSGNITINPTENKQPMARLYPESKMVIGYEVDVPMDFSTSGMGFDQGYEISNLDFSGMDQATLVIRYKNRIPLDMKLNISFRDSSLSEGSQELAKLDEVTIAAATTNEDGKATGESNNENDDIELHLSGNIIDDIAKANQLFISGRFSTPGNGSSPAKLYTDDYVFLKFLVRAKFDLTSNSDE